ncbi:uncharacterized protein LOC113353958 [Papaver somniferum]|uniref:uncharacterized protein LOC113353958 n=1 Tax=Papaver somniferum TaxID=3469 RepID=UPI000E703371|nr:uncharacterized protein LOC113353958 [Papaver somniferum]
MANLIRRSTSIVLLVMLFMIIYGVVEIRENTVSNSSYVHGEAISSGHPYPTRKLMMVVRDGSTVEAEMGRARMLRVSRNRFPPPKANTTPYFSPPPVPVRRSAPLHYK